jgi:hypothetical protein
MIKVRVRNLAPWRASLTRHRRQIPFAMATALTETARDVERNQMERLPRVFDRPTPFTAKRGMFVSRATKRRLVAVVGFKRVQAGYLRVQEEGGTRTPKGRALLVPAGARLNKYGNLPRNTVRRLLARPDTFSGEIRGVPGIWQRQRKGGVRLLIAYEPKARYDRRLGFGQSARRVIDRRWRINFERAWRRALATAR